MARVVLVEVEQDHEPVVDARPPDAPLVHERDRVRLRLVRRDARWHELRVDDDLGAGPALDLVDRLLELLDRRVAEHARLVVHRLVVDRLGERRPGRRDRQRTGSRSARPTRSGARATRRASGAGRRDPG